MFLEGLASGNMVLLQNKKYEFNSWGCLFGVGPTPIKINGCCTTDIKISSGVDRKGKVVIP